MIKFFLDPFTLFWLLLLLCAVCWMLKKEVLLKWLLGITAVWFLIISTPLVPNAVLNSLEDRYSPLFIEDFEDPELEYHIIVLGGGHGFDDRLPPNSLLSTNALMRLSEGIRLHRQLPNSKLVLSGSTSTPGRTTQAEMLRDTALLLGVSEEATIIQTEPSNTYQEAKVYSETFGERYPVILVTSAAHMPRAMNLFEHFEVRAVASPTNYRLKGSWKKKRFGMPSTGNIGRLRSGVYEYAAMTRDRWMR
jgi:uncharacterized SAM-binding protein YcdF (DUF218 family)